MPLIVPVDDAAQQHDRKLERRDSWVYFQPFLNPRGTTRESPYRLYGRSSRG